MATKRRTGLKRPSTQADVCIVETLEFLDEDTRREGEIISRTLKLSGKHPHYSYVRSSEELEAFMKEFGASSFRYLHLSCHGDVGTFFTTTDELSREEMVQLIGKRLKGRRLFVSACSATERQFAEELMRKGECHSVLGPASDISFDDAAIFWSSFYHLMVKKSPTTMTNADIEMNVAKCAKLVEEDFRFFYWKQNAVKEITIRGR